MMNPISPVQPVATRSITADGKGYEAPVQRQPSETLPSTAELRRAGRMGETISASDEQMVKMVDKALKALQGAQTNAELSVHQATKTIMIKIVNSETGELIREVPPEKTLDIVAKLIEVNGLLIDERV